MEDNQEVLTQESSEPHDKLPSLWVWHQEEPLDNLDLKAIGVRVHKIHRTRSTLLKGAYKVSQVLGPKAKHYFIGAWARPTYKWWRVSWGSRRCCDSLQGQGHCWWRARE